LSEDEFSFGELFETVDDIRLNSVRARDKTTEFHEKQIAQQVYDLATVMTDVISMIRGHLSCHDCQIVDHTHARLPGDISSGRVLEVFDGALVEDDKEGG
jgi:hypothetical protein